MSNSLALLLPVIPCVLRLRPAAGPACSDQLPARKKVRHRPGHDQAEGSLGHIGENRAPPLRAKNANIISGGGRLITNATRCAWPTGFDEGLVTFPHYHCYLCRQIMLNI